MVGGPLPRPPIVLGVRAAPKGSGLVARPWVWAFSRRPIDDGHLPCGAATRLDPGHRHVRNRRHSPCAFLSDNPRSCGAVLVRGYLRGAVLPGILAPEHGRGAELSEPGSEGRGRCGLGDLIIPLRFAPPGKPERNRDQHRQYRLRGTPFGNRLRPDGTSRHPYRTAHNLELLSGQRLRLPGKRLEAVRGNFYLRRAGRTTPVDRRYLWARGRAAGNRCSGYGRAPDSAVGPGPLGECCAPDVHRRTPER